MRKGRTGKQATEKMNVVFDGIAVSNERAGD